MYNRYVSSEHSYEPSEISEPSAAESEPYISKEKYIRENDTVQEGNAHSSAFFRNFGNIQAEKWKKLGGILSGTKSIGIGSVLSVLGLEDMDTGDILLFLIILFLLSEGDELDLVITLGLMLLMGLGEEKKNPAEEPTGFCKY